MTFGEMHTLLLTLWLCLKYILRPDRLFKLPWFWKLHRRFRSFDEKWIFQSLDNSIYNFMSYCPRLHYHVDLYWAMDFWNRFLFQVDISAFNSYWKISNNTRRLFQGNFNSRFSWSRIEFEIVRERLTVRHLLPVVLWWSNLTPFLTGKRKD